MEGEKVFIDATLLQANASLDSLMERKVYHQLKTTPEEYLDRVWKENPLESSKDLDESNSSGSDETPRAGRGPQEAFREKRKD